MNSSSILPRQATKKAPPPPPPPPAQRLELRGPRPHPLHPFYFGFKKKESQKEEKSAGQATKKNTPTPPSLSAQRRTWTEKNGLCP